MTDVIAQIEQYENDEQIASKLQKEYDDEAKAHQVQEEMNLEDEFDRATREHDQKVSEKKAALLHRQLNH